MSAANALDSAGLGTKSEAKEPTEAKKEEEETKFTEGLVSLKHGIFNYAKVKAETIERYEVTAQEYLEKNKIGVYLQDIVKIIIERKDERPHDLLSEYFSIAAKGEHVLLREYAFVSATPYNRKCFLQQINRIFHSSPYFTTITALDYHQLLCLLCSDFPRSIILEAIRVLDPESPPTEDTEEEGEVDPMFCGYKLGTLQRAVAIFFFYNEFMENLKTVFQEAESSPSLNINEETSAAKILSCLQTYLKRVSKTTTHPLPTAEGILETLACAAGLNSLFDKRTVTLPEDVAPLISDKISYKQFCQNFMANYAEIVSIYTGVDQQMATKTNDKLKEIITQHQQAVAMQATKKQKKKRKGN